MLMIDPPQPKPPRTRPDIKRSSNQQLLGQIDSGELSHKDIQIELSEDADEQHIEMNLDMGVFDVAPIPQEQEIQLVYKMAETGPYLLREVLESKGWVPFVEGETPYWNLSWKGSRYRKSEYEQCQPFQRLNHFPNTAIITRKDSLFRLLRTLKGIYGSVYDYFPLTFTVPGEFIRFVRLYAEEENNGNKFDMRCYVLVRSYQPLTVYLYEDGLARFATSRYDTSTLKNKFSHLTNTSINKFSPTLDANKDDVGPGCKWQFSRLRAYFEQRNLDFHKVWEK
nr:putative tubulin polyglutamylase ttll2 [Polyrhizophydium stewartii]